MTVKKKRKKKKRTGGHYHTGTHVSPKAGECIYRSGWELNYMHHLDADPTVTSYQYESVIIAYIANIRSTKLRKYIPDFLVEYVDGRKVLVEIKPKKRLDNVKVQKKLAAAEQWCLEHGATLEVVTEDTLRSIGAFKKVLLGSS